MPDAPADAVTTPLPRTLPSDAFTPRLLALVSNALVYRESSLLKAEFGLGTNDWRVVASLAVRPGMTGAELSEYLGTHEALVSRSNRVLSERGLITSSAGPGRSRHHYLTDEGARLHDLMLPISAAGQDVVLEGLSPEEVEHLNEVLRGMLAKLRAAGPRPHPS
ncbi:DNA-binding transcriptional regulator, MarR family [Quadrisphaera granulorum]|uniref:DNA-binding MarR family transcriptional regulator n=1 Tax=Quadrisphaera granulorum TaxID=317664 RepID=A0A316AAG2_9ACTN|nr:MarR family winged helix-turn-helix transcriptional regulator [Quadrisphaera granulorum]PWJ54389.1 DNA-binding MarR family transcriptional regulator [Quadrisphaera granulorum]SZE96161.1 DNA-binding transcriptional regulator, MarR family [Quadrisphaera granulorum]